MARKNGPSTDPAPLPETPRPIGGRPSSEPRTFDLDDVAPPDAVILNGEPYPLTRSGGLSIIEQARLARAWKAMNVISQKIEAGVEPSERERIAYRRHAETVAGLALKTASTELIAALSDEQIARLLLVYFTRAASTGGLSRTTRELLAASESSVLTSPSSSRSTAATP